MRRTRAFVAAGASLLLGVGVMLASGVAASAEEPSPGATTESSAADLSSTAAPVQQLDCDAITVNYQRPLQNGDHINLQFDPGAKQVGAYVDRNLGGYGDLGIRFSTGQTRPLTPQEVESGTIVWDYPVAIGSTTFTVTFVQTNQTDTWPNLSCAPEASPSPTAVPSVTTCGEGQVLAAVGSSCAPVEVEPSEGAKDPAPVPTQADPDPEQSQVPAPTPTSTTTSTPAPEPSAAETSTVDGGTAQASVASSTAVPAAVSKTAALAVTGSAVSPGLGLAAALAMMGGALLLVIAARRRRRSE